MLVLRTKPPSSSIYSTIEQDLDLPFAVCANNAFVQKINTIEEAHDNNSVAFTFGV